MRPELFLGVLASLTTSRSSLTEELRIEEEVSVLMARVRETEGLKEEEEEEAPPSVKEELTRLCEGMDNNGIFRGRPERHQRQLHSWIYYYIHCNKLTSIKIIKRQLDRLSDSLLDIPARQNWCFRQRRFRCYEDQKWNRKRRSGPCIRPRLPWCCCRKRGRFCSAPFELGFLIGIEGASWGKSEKEDHRQFVIKIGRFL